MELLFCVPCLPRVQNLQNHPVLLPSWVPSCFRRTLFAKFLFTRISSLPQHRDIIIQKVGIRLWFSVQLTSASGSQPLSHPQEGFSVSRRPHGLLDFWTPVPCGSEFKCQHCIWPGAVELFGINRLSRDRVNGITNHFLPLWVYVKCVKYQQLTYFSCVLVTLISLDSLTTTSITNSRCYFQASSWPSVEGAYC